MRTEKLVGFAAAAGVLTLLLAACSSSTGGRGSPVSPRPIEVPESGLTVVEEIPQSESAEPTGYADAASWWESLDPAGQVASVLMLHLPGTDTELFVDFVDRFQPGGIILMGDNIPEDESDLTEEIPDWAELGELPLLVAIDQEGGVVSRLDGDPGRSAMELRDGNPSVTEESFAARGDYLHSLGINVNFGIIADTTADQESFIWSRILGSTPEEAAEQVSAAVRGEAGRVLSALKHFPGHGTVAADSHLAVPSSQLSESGWLESAAVPFEAGIAAGADMVMMGHLAFPKIAAEPASISPKWHQILRDDLGFDGVIVTDDMKMLRDSGDPELADPIRNAVAALNAGSSLILDVGGDTGEDATQFAENLIDGLVEALDSGALEAHRLRDAGLLLLEVRAGLRP